MIEWCVITLNLSGRNSFMCCIIVRYYWYQSQHMYTSPFYTVFICNCFHSENLCNHCSHRSGSASRVTRSYLLTANICLKEKGKTALFIIWVCKNIIELIELHFYVSWVLTMSYVISTHLVTPCFNMPVHGFIYYVQNIYCILNFIWRQGDE